MQNSKKLWLLKGMLRLVACAGGSNAADYQKGSLFASVVCRFTNLGQCCSLWVSCCSVRQGGNSWYVAACLSQACATKPNEIHAELVHGLALDGRR